MKRNQRGARAPEGVACIRTRNGSTVCGPIVRDKHGARGARSNPLPPPMRSSSKASTLEGMKKAYAEAPIERWILAGATALRLGYDAAAGQGWLPDQADLIADTIDYAQRYAIDQDPAAQAFFAATVRDQYEREVSEIEAIAERVSAENFARYYRNGLWIMPDLRSPISEQQAYWRDVAELRLWRGAASLAAAVRQHSMHQAYSAVSSMEPLFALPPFTMMGRTGKRSKTTKAEEMLASVVRETLTGRR